MVVPAREHTGLDAEPDVSMLVVEILALIANATIKAEVTPHLSPAAPGEGKSPAKVSPQEKSAVLRRLERRLPANGRTNAKVKNQSPKPMRFPLPVLAFY